MDLGGVIGMFASIRKKKKEKKRMSKSAFKIFYNSEFLSYKNDLKKHLLYFDEILIDDSMFFHEERFARMFGHMHNKKEVLFYNIAQFKFLEEKGLIKRINLLKSSSFQDKFDSLNLGDKLLEVKNDVIEFAGPPRLDMTKPKGFSPLDRKTEFCDVFSRIGTQMINEKQKDVVPIINSIQPQQLELNTKKEGVLNVIINKFPIPLGDVSWEQILDFRADEDSRRKLLGLRSWITKIGYSNLTINKIEQEVEYLIMEYENRMKLHKMKYQYGNIELVTMGIAEVLENLVKLKFSKLAKSIFDLKKRNIDVLIGETKAPGKEMAYISKMKNELK